MASMTRHVVGLTAADLERLAPGALDHARLVRETFGSCSTGAKGSILSTFDLSVVGRYFPEYERDIAR